MKTSHGEAVLNRARLCHVREVMKYVPGIVAWRFGIDTGPSAADAAILSLLNGTVETVPLRKPLRALRAASNDATMGALLRF